MNAAKSKKSYLSGHKRAYFLLAVVVLGVFLFLCDPSACSFAPKCSFKLLTSLDCPGCGIQRALHALLHGHWEEAWAYNRYLIYALPFLFCVMITEWCLKGKAQRKWRKVFEGKVAIYLYLVSYFAWGIYRNLAHI